MALGEHVVLVSIFMARCRVRLAKFEFTSSNSSKHHCWPTSACISSPYEVSWLIIHVFLIVRSTDMGYGKGYHLSFMRQHITKGMQHLDGVSEMGCCDMDSCLFDMTERVELSHTRLRARIISSSSLSQVVRKLCVRALYACVLSMRVRCLLLLLLFPTAFAFFFCMFDACLMDDG